MSSITSEENRNVQLEISTTVNSLLKMPAARCTEATLEEYERIMKKVTESKNLQNRDELLNKLRQIHDEKLRKVRCKIEHQRVYATFVYQFKSTNFDCKFCNKRYVKHYAFVNHLMMKHSSLIDEIKITPNDLLKTMNAIKLGKLNLITAPHGKVQDAEKVQVEAANVQHYREDIKIENAEQPGPVVPLDVSVTRSMQSTHLRNDRENEKPNVAPDWTKNGNSDNRKRKLFKSKPVVFDSDTKRPASKEQKTSIATTTPTIANLQEEPVVPLDDSVTSSIPQNHQCIVTSSMQSCNSFTHLRNDRENEKPNVAPDWTKNGNGDNRKRKLFKSKSMVIDADTESPASKNQMISIATTTPTIANLIEQPGKGACKTYNHSQPDHLVEKCSAKNVPKHTEGFRPYYEQHQKVCSQKQSGQILGPVVPVSSSSPQNQPCHLPSHLCNDKENEKSNVAPDWAKNGINDNRKRELCKSKSMVIDADTESPASKKQKICIDTTTHPLANLIEQPSKGPVVESGLSKFKHNVSNVDLTLDQEDEVGTDIPIQKVPLDVSVTTSAPQNLQCNVISTSSQNNTEESQRQSDQNLDENEHLQEFRNMIEMSLMCSDPILNAAVIFPPTNLGNMLISILTQLQFICCQHLIFSADFNLHLSLFLMKYAQQLAIGSVKISRLVKRPIATYENLAFLLTVEPVDNNSYSVIEVTTLFSNKLVRQYIPRSDKLRRSIFHLSFLELSNKPTSVDLAIQQLSAGSNFNVDLFKLYKSEISEMCIEGIRFACYKCVYFIALNFINSSLATLNLNKDFLVTWEYFKKEIFNLKFYENKSNVYSSMDWASDVYLSSSL